LRYAVVAAETKNFSRAAEILNVKQSTLSKRILALEQRLGIILFERSTRGAIPTKAGADFFDVASRIIGDIDSLRNTARAIGRGEAGSLVVGFCSSLSAGNLRVTVADYLKRFPAVRLNGIEGTRDRLLQGLIPTCIDYDPWAHWRSPMDMMRQG
jgi:DNA-binding transcriptional LysR family regulator